MTLATPPWTINCYNRSTDDVREVFQHYHSKCIMGKLLKIGDTLIGFDPERKSSFASGSRSVPNFVKIWQKLPPWECRQSDIHTDRDDIRDLIICSVWCYSNGTDNNEYFASKLDNFTVMKVEMCLLFTATPSFHYDCANVDQEPHIVLNFDKWWKFQWIIKKYDELVSRNKWVLVFHH